MTNKQLAAFAVDAILVPAHTFSRGRPSNAQELQIERKLRDCFTKFYSTSFTVEHTGHDVKTVKKYFKKFKDDLMQNEAIDFPQRFHEAQMKQKGCVWVLVLCTTSVIPLKPSVHVLKPYSI